MTIPSVFVPMRRRGSSSSGESPIFALQRQMSRLFDDFFPTSDWAQLKDLEQRTAAFMPRINVSESDKEVSVQAELPGMTEKDIEVSWHDGVLTLRGERKNEVEKKEGTQVVHIESSYGFFERSIPLNVEIREDKIDASFKNGVLMVTLPKSAEAEKRRQTISVRAA